MHQGTLYCTKHTVCSIRRNLLKILAETVACRSDYEEACGPSMFDHSNFDMSDLLMILARCSYAAVIGFADDVSQSTNFNRITFSVGRTHQGSQQTVLSGHHSIKGYRRGKKKENGFLCLFALSWFKL